MSGAPLQRPSAVVTRPRPESDHWVAQLQARGIQARSLPLIEIQPAVDADSITQAWAELGYCKAVMFVSRFAVDAFFAHRPALAAGMDSVRMWSTGPGTRAALLRQGVAGDRLDNPPEGGTQYDSEALWNVVNGQVQPGNRVLVVRGQDGDGPTLEGGAGRDWLARRLIDSGVQVRFVVAYRRLMPSWPAGLHTLARTASSDGSVWIFTSGRAVDHLTRLLPRQSWSAARALATHPRIALAVRDAGFGVLRETRPDLASVVASIESFE